MKQVGGIFDCILERDNLVLAAWRAAKGKQRRSNVRGFLANFNMHLTIIHRQLRQEDYRFSPYRSFPVRDTKTRTIHAPSFVDRVVHHAIIAAAGPTFERGALVHSYACRKGRGQHAALTQAAAWTRRTDWYAKMDVRKFYDSIDHGILRGLLRRRFREQRLLRLFDRLLDSYEASPGKGLPIGALTSQYLGNFYLDEFDRRLKASGLAHRYLRYMDDAVVWGTGESLAKIRQTAKIILDSLQLAMKNGGEWNRCERGLPFLGFIVYPDRLRLGKPGRRRLRHKQREMEKALAGRRIGEYELQQRGTALFAHACYGDDVGWRCEINRLSHYEQSTATVGEALEPSSRNPGRFLEQFRQELPLRNPQQEHAGQPQQESGLSCLSGSRHGGTLPPDVALSRSRSVTDRDETTSKSPADPEIQTRSKIPIYGEEKGPVGAFFTIQKDNERSQ